jgi:hypothetical protein
MTGIVRCTQEGSNDWNCLSYGLSYNEAEIMKVLPLEYKTQFLVSLAPL